jgi:hypothetical protein
VPNTPEFKHASSKKINYTISNDDIQIKSSDLSNKLAKTKQGGKVDVIIPTIKVETITKAPSSLSLNTAIIDNDDKKSVNAADDLNDARWFDHDIDIDENLDLDENINDRQIIDIDDEEDDDEEEEDDEDEEYNSSSDTSQLSTTKSAPSQSPSRLLQMNNQNNSIGNRQLSLSLSNLPQASGQTETSKDEETMDDNQKGDMYQLAVVEPSNNKVEDNQTNEDSTEVDKENNKPMSDLNVNSGKPLIKFF